MHDPIAGAFVVLPLLLVAALIAGVAHASRRLGEPPGLRARLIVITTIAAAIWMGATWAAARSGALSDFTRTPPPFAILVVTIILLAIRIGLTRYGRRLALGLPLWVLIGVQAFRLPLELAMHGLAERGVMPPQMTYTGRNFDIVTGATAIVVAVVAWRAQPGVGPLPSGARWLAAAWNALGLALLVNVVTIAILSTPRIRYFGDDRVNVFVTQVPYVWLPAVLVLAALAGHLVIYRGLRAAGRQPR